MGYSVWLEFEEYVGSDLEDNEDGYCNIAVIHDDGRHVGYNVWTSKFFQNRIWSILNEVAEKGFATLPDIVVTRLEREHIVEVLKQIVPET